MIGIDPSHRKFSGERLSVKYTKDMAGVGQEKSATRLESTRAVTTRLGKSRLDLLEV